jgi:hypothetical protein
MPYRRFSRVAKTFSILQSLAVGGERAGLSTLTGDYAHDQRVRPPAPPARAPPLALGPNPVVDGVQPNFSGRVLPLIRIDRQETDDFKTALSQMPEGRDGAGCASGWRAWARGGREREGEVVLPKKGLGRAR